MATIFPPTFRNIGTRQVVQWLAGEYCAAGPTKVTIHAFSDATYLTAGVGAESVDIGVGGAAPVTVPSDATCTTAANWATRINSVIGSTVAAVGTLGELRLQHSSRIRVTAYGGSGGAAAAFNVIGLPKVDRDSAAPITRLSVGERINIQHLSSSVDVPSGSNLMSAYVRVFGNDPSMQLLGFFPAFSNGTEGEPGSSVTDGIGDTGPTTFSGIGKLTVAPFLDGEFDPSLPGQRALSEIQIIGQINNSFLPRLFTRVFEYRIPRGMTKVRIFCPIAFGDNLDGAPSDPKADVPQIEAVITFGAG